MNEKAHTVLHCLDCAFDSANARLWRGGEVINLRPKSLAVLTYLVNRPEQLVTKDELLESGDLDAPLLPIAEARTLVESTREQRIEAELHRMEGAIRLQRGEVDAARRCIRRAIQLAEQQGAHWWELRATTSLARLGLRKGQPSSFRRAGRDALARVVGAFTEGDDTADVQEARRLLALCSCS